MQKNRRDTSIAFWTSLVVSMLLFGGWEAYGCYKTDTGSTHRAWTLQVILGGLLILGTVVASTPALLMAKDKREILAIAIFLICLGLAPLVVRLLWHNFPAIF